MMASTGDSGSREELTTELATLDRQLRDLSNQWENVERTISEKVRKRRELIARQAESNEDHAAEIDRLQSDIYALRDRLDQLRDSHLDFSALYRILQKAAHNEGRSGPTLPSPRGGGDNRHRPPRGRE